MSFDASRFTFDHRKNFDAVAMEQGRVQTDADWNEWLAEIARRMQAGTLDTLGRAVYPMTTPNAFEIAADTSGGSNTLRIGVGRMYVDGILAENHGDPGTAVWDPALAELSNAPQPPSLPPKPLDATNSIDFTAQPYAPGATLPAGAGSYLAYLDVWRRPITYIEDPSLIDAAIGLDTTGRIQTAWQVRLMPLAGVSVAGSVTSGSFVAGEAVKQSGSGATATLIGTVTGSGPMYLGAVSGAADAAGAWVGGTSGAIFTPSGAPVDAGWSCSTPDSAIPWPATSGRLSNGTVTSGPSGPCCLTTGTGFTGPENQLYRVEIHNPGGGNGAGATFKWSRENASVQTNVTAINPGSNTLGGNASVLTVLSLGRDQVLGFAVGDWIEISDQTHDDNCQPGELYQIDGIQVASSTITLTGLLSSHFTAASLAANAYTRICRWDQSGTVHKADNTAYIDLDATGSGGLVNGALGIPVPTDGSALILEGGITVTFSLDPSTGAYQPLDFWCFSARAATGTIDILADAPPMGQHHHYTKLSVVTFGGAPGATDCRTPWPPGGSGTSDCGCCCTVTVGVDGAGAYSSINQAIQALPHAGGEVCILPGRYYEHVLLQGRRNVVIRGCGAQTIVSSPSLAPNSQAPADNLIAVFTIEACEALTLEHLTIETNETDIGVLLDRLHREPPPPDPIQVAAVERDVVSNFVGRNTGVTLRDLAISAARAPAIAALVVTKLHVAENVIGMRDVNTPFPAVYLRGLDMVFERNIVRVIVGIHVILNPVEATRDTTLQAAFHERIGAAGGVQVGGPSKNVVIVENEITGSARNGVTLGDIITLNRDGRNTGGFNGQTVGDEDPCAGGSGSIPGSGGGGNTRVSFGAGGLIENLIIDRNLITDCGLCGIGPVGFFNLHKTAEVVSLINVTVSENIIARTLLRTLEAFDDQASVFGYGAISLPDVETLTIRDNTVTDYGVRPGAEVCGVYVLHGAMIEISRNRIEETRDNTTEPEAQQAYGGQRAGIFIELATPKPVDTAAGSAWSKAFAAASQIEDISALRTPLYNPGLPALRIQENMVRVAMGLALSARGTGPFSIVDNHFSTGGAVRLRSDENREFQLASPELSGLKTLNGALTVSILNLGVGLEGLAKAQGFSSVFASFAGASADAFALASGRSSLTTSGSGGVLFTNNVCQFENRGSRVRGLSSVSVLSLDSVLFSNNHLWFDASPITAATDALVLAPTVQVTSNRMQEAPGFPVLFSGATLGLANITSQNLATYCLEIAGRAQWTVKTPNVELDTQLCRESQKRAEEAAHA